MIIRPMTAEDTEVVATLSGQLGYLLTPTRIRERYEAIIRDPDNGLFVAERDGVILGWVHVLGVHFLASVRSFAEIGGLVVDENARRRGVGRVLVSKAEEWARGNGYHEVRLRSGLPRTEAHEFYQAIGYELAKTSHMFRKALNPGSCP